MSEISKISKKSKISKAVLSICEVEVFSPTDLAPAFCASSIQGNMFARLVRYVSWVRQLR